MTAPELIALAGRHGVVLWAHGSRVRWRCRGPFLDDLRAQLVAHKDGVLAALRAAGPCPGCRRDRDAAGRCWRCCDRPCVMCGRPTGSAFIATCFPCGNQLPDPLGGTCEDGRTLDAGGES